MDKRRVYREMNKKLGISDILKIHNQEIQALSYFNNFAENMH